MGRVDVNLKYEENNVSSNESPLPVAVDLDVLLVEDVLYQIGRDGVRDISAYIFGP